MCIWCIIRKIAQLHGIVLRNQHESEEGGGHQTIAATPNSERNLEASRHDGGTQLIHIQARRTWYAFLQAIMQGRWLPVG
jgi:hypothetical protein